MPQEIPSQFFGTLPPPLVCHVIWIERTVMTTAPIDSPAVLIVEDHADTRELFALVFESAGFTVCSVGTVAEAMGRLLAVTSLPPDLILSDIVMPGASGAEFIRYLGVNAALKQIPIIVVTGAKLTEVPLEATLVVQKPVDPYALVSLANEVLSGQLAVAPNLRVYSRLNTFDSLGTFGLRRTPAASPIPSRLSPAQAIKSPV